MGDDFNDMDTEITPPEHPMRDPLPLPYCAEHTSVARELSEVAALVRCSDARGTRIEGRLHEMDTKLDKYIITTVELRRDMAYHGKFWGAIAGGITAFLWWLIGRVAG